MSDGHGIRDGGIEERKRLIDHFKRVYNIVAGLAITEAVRRQFPLTPGVLLGPSPWIFLTFFVTLVPIFHGGDRSLDLKYLSEPRTTGRQRFWYLWDVYILLFTAILFVAIAEAIPRPEQLTPTATGRPYGATTVFFAMMAFTMIFDAGVLAVDRLKAEERLRPKLSAYRVWIGLNLLVGAVCVAAAFATNGADATGAVVVHGNVLPLAWLFPAIAVIAIARTGIDYHVGDDFLWP